MRNSNDKGQVRVIASYQISPRIGNDKGQVRVIAGTCHRGQATSLRTESLPD